MFCILVLATFPALLLAHVDEYDNHLLTSVFKPNVSLEYCEGTPQIISYHIHVLFWQNNPDHVTSATKLRSDFIAEFQLEGKECNISPADPAPGHEMCVFRPDEDLSDEDLSMYMTTTDTYKPISSNLTLTRRIVMVHRKYTHITSTCYSGRTTWLT